MLVRHGNHGNCVLLRGFALLRQPGKSRKADKPRLRLQAIALLSGSLLPGGRTLGAITRFLRNFRGNFCRAKIALQSRKLRAFARLRLIAATREIAEGR
jgi:hypothetical protein